jgi:predicted DNA-binding helix-hairpin-helix protein
MRLYRVRLSELPFDQNGNLIPDIDPKLAMAKAHPERFPVDVNRAEYEELLTVPGIGPISASRIVRRRAIRRIADERDLAFCGVVVSRAAPFILIDGRRVEAPPPPRKPKDNAKQLSLFDTAEVLCEKL